MNVYESLGDFERNTDFTHVNEDGYREWILGSHLHVGDAVYRNQRQSGTDQLGFQPLLLTYVNPKTRTTRKFMIKHVNDEVLNRFLNSSRQKFLTDFESRHGSFRPAETHVFAEYPDWDSFHSVWMERGGVSTLDKHLPLLFDHTPAVEYWTRRQTGLEVLPYQRLLITTYFAPKERFFDFFIKNVDDNEMDRIKLLAHSRLGLNLDRLYSTPLSVV